MHKDKHKNRFCKNPQRFLCQKSVFSCSGHFRQRGRTPHRKAFPSCSPTRSRFLPTFPNPTSPHHSIGLATIRSRLRADLETQRHGNPNPQPLIVTKPSAPLCPSRHCEPSMTEGHASSPTAARSHSAGMVRKKRREVASATGYALTFQNEGHPSSPVLICIVHNNAQAIRFPDSGKSQVPLRHAEERHSRDVSISLYTG